MFKLLPLAWLDNISPLARLDNISPPTRLDNLSLPVWLKTSSQSDKNNLIQPMIFINIVRVNNTFIVLTNLN